MKCIICNSGSSYYFSKNYTESPFDEFMQDIGKVDYYRCEHCGFVLSKTHSELDENKWNNLNSLFHHYIENQDNDSKGNQPPYAEQAMMIALLGKNGIISTKNMIDYAAGYGTLSHILEKYFDCELPIFDQYVQAANSNKYVGNLENKSYKTVINSAMFEHVLTRDNLEQVNNLVVDDDSSSLIIHTVVCEKVPCDPNWFYLRPPVHTSFHTNKSMDILMSQWGYQSSIYCPQSKCWVLLREKVDDIVNKVVTINKELQTNWFYCKNGFVDYWKGF